LASIAGISFVCIALLNANEVWERATFSIAMAALLTSFVAALYSSGARRAFWIGFAVFGSGYSLLYWNPLGNTGHELITNDCLAIVLERLPASHGMARTQDIYQRVGMLNARRDIFFRVGHTLWTVILALAGGLIARFFYLQRQKQDARLPEHSPKQ
jgi:hypothetical protein